MASPFDKQYMMLFKTTEVTQQQIDYLVLVDRYRNNMVADNQIKMLPDNEKFDLKKLAEDVRIQEGTYLREGAAAAEKLGLQRAGETGVARYLRDVKTLYPDITEYHRFNMRMEELAAQAKAAPAHTHKRVNLNAFVPAFVAEAFNIGANAGRDFADEVTSIAKKKAEKLKPLNLPEREVADYMILTTEVEMKVKLAKIMHVSDIPELFESQLGHYPKWAAKNGLSDEQKREFDPVVSGMERAAQAQEVLRERQR